MSKLFELPGGPDRLPDEFAPMFWPTTNATSLVDGFWAPVASTLGRGQPHGQLPRITTSPKSHAAGTRRPGADVNPYLA